MRVGIVDVGTNTCHVLVGEVGSRGRVRIVLQRHDRVPLGGSARLTAAAMRRAITVLGRQASSLREACVDRIEAVATSAVREAANGRAFLQRARRRTGLPLRLITGAEEARLIYEGVVWVNRLRTPALVIAIGGGSLQVMRGTGSRFRHAVSLPLGGSRLAQQFLRRDPPRPHELEALRRHVSRALRPAISVARGHRGGVALGSSRLIAEVMRAVLKGRQEAGNRKQETLLTISRRAVRRYVEEASGEADVMATAVVLLEWMEGCRISRLRYAPGSVREGLMWRLTKGREAR